MIILLDGSKGAGKTSVGKILVHKIKDAHYLSLDEERRNLKPRAENMAEANRQAFKKILEKLEALIIFGTNIIIDSGLTQERVNMLEEITRDQKVYRFLLKADRGVELERVRGRDKEKSKDTDVERFHEVYDIVHSKELKDFNVIETDKLSVDEVVGEILEHLKTK